MFKISCVYLFKENACFFFGHIPVFYIMVMVIVT